MKISSDLEPTQSPSIPLPRWARWILILNPVIWAASIGGMVFIFASTDKSIDVYDRWAKIASAITIMLSALIAATMVVYNVLWTRRYQQAINLHNRRIAAAFDLYKEYYADREFVTGRLEVWSKLRELAAQVPDESKWDLLQWGKITPTKEAVYLDVKQFAILNKIYTFYFRLRLLLEVGEVDEQIASDLFVPNYLIWDEFRRKFYIGTTEPSWRKVVEPIAVLTEAEPGDASVPARDAE